MPGPIDVLILSAFSASSSFSEASSRASASFSRISSTCFSLPRSVRSVFIRLKRSCLEGDGSDVGKHKIMDNGSIIMFLDYLQYNYDFFSLLWLSCKVEIKNECK